MWTKLRGFWSQTTGSQHQEGMKESLLRISKKSHDEGPTQVTVQTGRSHTVLFTHNKKINKRYYLLSGDYDPDSTSWKQNNLKDKTEWVCCHFFSPHFLSRLKSVWQQEQDALLSVHWSRCAAAHFPLAAFMKLLTQRLSTKITVQ